MAEYKNHLYSNTTSKVSFLDHYQSFTDRRTAKILHVTSPAVRCIYTYTPVAARRKRRTDGVYETHTHVKSVRSSRVYMKLIIHIYRRATSVDDSSTLLSINLWKSLKSRSFQGFYASVVIFKLVGSGIRAMCIEMLRNPYREILAPRNRTAYHRHKRSMEVVKIIDWRDSTIGLRECGFLNIRARTTFDGIDKMEKYYTYKFRYG